MDGYGWQPLSRDFAMTNNVRVFLLRIILLQEARVCGWYNSVALHCCEEVFSFKYTFQMTKKPSQLDSSFHFFLLIIIGARTARTNSPFWNYITGTRLLNASTSDTDIVPDFATLHAYPRYELLILLNAWHFPWWSFPHGQLVLVMEAVPPAREQPLLRKPMSMACLESLC